MDARRTEPATGQVVTEREHADIRDPVAVLAAGARPPELLLVQGRPVIEHGRVVTVDETEAAATAAATAAAVHHQLLNRQG